MQSNYVDTHEQTQRTLCMPHVERRCWPDKLHKLGNRHTNTIHRSDGKTCSWTVDCTGVEERYRIATQEGFAFPGQDAHQESRALALDALLALGDKRDMRSYLRLGNHPSMRQVRQCEEDERMTRGKERFVIALGSICSNYKLVPSTTSQRILPPHCGTQKGMSSACIDVGFSDGLPMQSFPRTILVHEVWSLLRIDCLCSTTISVA